ncbi:YtxH domain-containing protein [Algivirga pacifica]|uniref:Gas vesicle protein n=1 Tax=Algivirga pacifica TaxID=1162670 RepID=A0ABP9D9V4_9BACT
MKNGTLLAFLAGTAIGAVAGLLLAPDSGTETQRKLTNDIKRLQGELDHQIVSGRDKIENYKSMIKQKQDELSGKFSSKTATGPSTGHGPITGQGPITSSRDDA